MARHRGTFCLVDDATQELIAWAQGTQFEAASPFEVPPRTVVPLSLPVPELVQDGWHPALVTPGLQPGNAGQELTLQHSQGAVCVRY